MNSRKALEVQVDKDIYISLDYMSPDRMAAFSYQFNEIVKLKPQSILEIGIGNGLLSFLLRKAGFEVTTLDFDPSLEPDITASVTDIPCPDNSFDVVVGFEVLEHLPFDLFQTSLEEMRRVTKRSVVISLPDSRTWFRVYLPRIGKRKFLFNKPFFRFHEHQFDGHHYWQINTKNHSLSRIKKTIKNSGFLISDTYRIWEYPKHRMFVLSKGGCNASA